MKKLLLLGIMFLGMGGVIFARDVKKLGTQITFETALSTSDPFVIVQNDLILCGPLSPTDGSLTYKNIDEFEDFAYTFKFEEDAENTGSYFMHLYNQNSEDKGYVNASVWSHTYLSGVDKNGTKGECQNGALWTISAVGEKLYTIRNLGVTQGYYNDKPNQGDGDRTSKGFLAFTTGAYDYWKNHATHYNESGTWEFYTLETITLPDNDPIYYGWDQLTFDTDPAVTVNEETRFVRDARENAPYWTETAKWKLDTPFDASNYQYLVFYAKRNVTRYGNGDSNTGGTVFIKDDSGTSFRGEDYVKYKDRDYPSHKGKMWMNIWNEQRAVVIDLKWLANDDKYGDESECQVLDITKIKAFGFSGDFTIGGAFFTNTLPDYSAGNYKRSFDSFDKFGTICLPYSAVCCGAEIYEIVGATASGITLAEHEGIMEAGKPYFYQTLEAKEQHWGNVNDETEVYFFKAGYATVDTPVENNGLIGTFAATTAPQGDNFYVLSNNKLYYTTGATVNVGANKAYIDKSKIVNKSSEAKGRISINFNDIEATGIEAIDAADVLNNGKIYDLSGREVSQPTRGIYIMNGKKIVIK